MRRSLVLLLALVVALATAGQVSAAPARAAASPLAMTGGTGTGGAFNPLAARLVDTRNGTGGYSTPLAVYSGRAYQVTGVGGVPASGVSSVAVTVTALNPADEGGLTLYANGSSTNNTFLTFQAGENTSNTGVVDVGPDGKIAVRSDHATDILIDVQGYFTTGNGTPAPGGYVTAQNTRIVNTPAGVGASGPRAAGSTTTFTATGNTSGIPASATAIYANITIRTTTTASTTGVFI